MSENHLLRFPSFNSAARQMLEGNFFTDFGLQGKFLILPNQCQDIGI